MINNEDYELLKENLKTSQRLFEKLNRVADQYAQIEYDESGFSFEQEELLEGHWLKLGTKIIQELHTLFDTYSLELLKNETLDERRLKIVFLKDDIRSKLSIDYSQGDALSISQIS